MSDNNWRLYVKKGLLEEQGYYALQDKQENGDEVNMVREPNKMSP